MKLDQPIADAAYAPFFIRVSLGAFLLLSGKAKLAGFPGFVLPEFVAQMQGMKVMPESVATVYAILIPYLELVAGAFLVVGFWNVFAAVLSAAIFGVSVYLWGLYPTEGKMILNKDVLLLAMSISLFFSGAGFMSIDRFRRGP